MKTSFLSVLTNLKKTTSEKCLPYMLGLMLTHGEKNCASICREHKISYRLINSSLTDDKEYIEYCKKRQIQSINLVASQSKKKLLIIDFTLASKRFLTSDFLVTYDYDGCTKRPEKGYSMGIAAWSNGKVTIPIEVDYWLRKKDAGDKYRKKTLIAQNLISKLKQTIPFSMVLLDGGFASIELLQFFKENKISYCIRMPRNRIISSKNFFGRIDNCPSLKHVRNEKFKKIRALYKGIFLFVVAQKRQGKKGQTETVFIVTDKCNYAKDCVKMYDKRWKIEKFNRTAKQKLGFAKCQSPNYKKQRVHIWIVFRAYTILELTRYAKKKKSIEDVLKILQWQKSTKEFGQCIELIKTFA